MLAVSPRLAARIRAVCPNLSRAEGPAGGASSALCCCCTASRVKGLLCRTVRLPLPLCLLPQLLLLALLLPATSWPRLKTAGAQCLRQQGKWRVHGRNQTSSKAGGAARQPSCIRKAARPVRCAGPISPTCGDRCIGCRAVRAQEGDDGQRPSRHGSRCTQSCVERRAAVE